MKILGILQNQWFRDPAHVRAMLARETDPIRHEKLRRRLIEYALFAGCKTGRVLKKVFGEKLCEKIIWDEASREIAGESSGVFPADPIHLRKLVDEVKPDVIVCFGNVARDGMTAVTDQMVVFAPHPAARAPDTMDRLRASYQELLFILEALEELKREEPAAMEDVEL